MMHFIQWQHKTGHWRRSTWQYVVHGWCYRENYWGKCAGGGYDELLGWWHCHHVGPIAKLALRCKLSAGQSSGSASSSAHNRWIQTMYLVFCLWVFIIPSYWEYFMSWHDNGFCFVCLFSSQELRWCPCRNIVIQLTALSTRAMIHLLCKSVVAQVPMICMYLIWFELITTYLTSKIRYAASATSKTANAKHK